jgi:two-component system, NarL family, response regulator DevR
VITIDSSPIRVLLVDEQVVVRKGIRALLETEPDIVVTGDAGGVAEAIDLVDATRPNIIVTDIKLSDGSGAQLTRRVLENHPKARVLILASQYEERSMFAAITAGACGFLLKQVGGEELVRSIRTVAAGNSLLDPTITRAVLDRLRGGKRYRGPDRLANLTPQEERILELLGEGLTSRKIGEELHLAEKTVRNYVSSIFSKLGVGSRAESVAYLARRLRSEAVDASV